MLGRVGLFAASPFPSLPFARFVGFAAITTVSQSASVFVFFKKKIIGFFVSFEDSFS
jgi:hypothetical protein